ncbi:hypothetical protein [Silanimonas sp.]|jgi:hypothetical protein|uniref:hypothetical protein n=1 Tax=Silanimonas sp. TaxID=1929290 RepID=UPI0037CA8E09
MNVLNSLAGIALLVAAAPSYGANVRCDHCGESAAQSLAQSMGPGDHVVFSLSQNVAYAYSNECDPSTPGFDPATALLCVFPRQLTSGEAEEFALAHLIYVQTGGSMKFERNVPIRDIEPPRLSRRLRTLRGLEHEQIGEVRTRGA